MKNIAVFDPDKGSIVMNAALLAMLFNEADTKVDVALRAVSAASVAATGAISAGGAITAGGASTVTVQPAVATPGTVRSLRGAMTVAAAGMTAGNLVGTRGDVTIPNGVTVNGASFLYGSQGKLISGTGTIDVGSGYACGTIGQMDLTGARISSGHVAPIIGSLQGCPASSYVNGIYVESNSPNKVNAVLQGIINADFAMDITSEDGNSAYLVASAGAPSGDYLRIKVSGVEYRLALLAAS